MGKFGSFTSINTRILVFLRNIRNFGENPFFMKHIHYLIAGLLLSTCYALQAKNRVIDRPPFCVRNTTSIEVSKVVISDTATVLHVYAKYRPKYWIRIAAGSYLKDNNGETYQLRSGIGITPDKEFWLPESGESEFQLVFPPLPDNATSIDFTEGAGIENAFSIWGIQLKSKKLPELVLPEEAVVHPIDRNATLPEPVIQYGKAMLKCKILDYHPGAIMGQGTEIVMWENAKGDMTEIIPEIQSDGTFTKEVTLTSTTPCSMYINSAPVKFFMEPGKTTSLYINLRELSRRQSKFHSQKSPYGEMLYVNGPLETVAQELNRNLPDVNMQEKLFKDITVLAGMDFTAANAYITKLYEETQAKIETSACSTSTRQLLSTDNELNLALIRRQLPSLLTNAAIRANKIKRDEAEGYYKELVQKMPKNDMAETDIAYLNTPQSILSDRYMNLAGDYMSQSAALAQAWGTDKGIFFDLIRSYPLYRGIKSFIPLADEQKTALATMPAALREMLTAANDELLAKIEDNKKKTGYTIHKVEGNVSNEDLFASITGKYKGKALLVDFWATWCGPCRMANKAIAPMKEELKGKDIVYLYITGETSPLNTWENMIPDIHGEHYRVTNAQWKYLGDKFKVEGVPTYLIVDREGNIKFRHTGFPGVDKMKEEVLKAATD